LFVTPAEGATAGIRPHAPALILPRALALCLPDRNTLLLSRLSRNNRLTGRTACRLNPTARPVFYFAPTASACATSQHATLVQSADFFQSRTNCSCYGAYGLPPESDRTPRVLFCPDSVRNIATRHKSEKISKSKVRETHINATHWRPKRQKLGHRPARGST